MKKTFRDRLKRRLTLYPEEPVFLFRDNGILTFDETGTTYRGTENEVDKEIFIPIKRSSRASLQKEKFLVMYGNAKIIGFEFEGSDSQILKAEAAIKEFHAKIDPAWDRALCRAYYPKELQGFTK